MWNLSMFTALLHLASRFHPDTGVKASKTTVMMEFVTRLERQPRIGKKHKSYVEVSARRIEQNQTSLAQARNLSPENVVSGVLKDADDDSNTHFAYRPSVDI
ncbi:hypothetical protein PRIPAC_86232 [Pristionchus pacificus]|uniref:Uncharacterized protein n=1 Tax=Pristionchus pacificus TaxID=54126 RepID=A0A2A6BTK8_PRIPA|nr:hypothetical protein PRIPAC_86232 [Pristionchus pacificus]|eukprot:PDM69322.1 hypothetical protein PRIPAC_47624 [Pristionchus pacificus]